MKKHSNKLEQYKDQLPSYQLDSYYLPYLQNLTAHFNFTFQELRLLITILNDFQMWQHKELDFSKVSEKSLTKKSAVLSKMESTWNNLKNSPKSYVLGGRNTTRDQFGDIKFKTSNKRVGDVVVGRCPVASEKTLCCNLITLDAVNNCGFNCSYCSIQSFFDDKTITFEKDLYLKLKNIKFESDKLYHIGTGQSSDSLMWGNRGDTLRELFQFSKENPNVILEFKTKSKNIDYFCQTDVPQNIVCTWSLNPQAIIDNEEHLTASLKDRLKSARKLADKGIYVGFHLHPIIYYQNFEKDYKELVTQILDLFDATEILMISLGTLTFTKSTLKNIRNKNIHSKILQMPLDNTHGKFSYPIDMKVKMFSYINQLFQPWHEKVFFYLCMEDKEIWESVFGKSYINNDDFEISMNNYYMQRLKRIGK